MKKHKKRVKIIGGIMMSVERALKFLTWEELESIHDYIILTDMKITQKTQKRPANIRSIHANYVMHVLKNHVKVDPPVDLYRFGAYFTLAGVNIIKGYTTNLTIPRTEKTVPCFTPMGVKEDFARNVNNILAGQPIDEPKTRERKPKQI